MYILEGDEHNTPSSPLLRFIYIFLHDIGVVPAEYRTLPQTPVAWGYLGERWTAYEQERVAM
jgi:hypothetical protein